MSSGTQLSPSTNTTMSRRVGASRAISRNERASASRLPVPAIWSTISRTALHRSGPISVITRWWIARISRTSELSTTEQTTVAPPSDRAAATKIER